MRPTANFTCCDCQTNIENQAYGNDPNTKEKICDNCCNKRDDQTMLNDDRYFCYGPSELSIGQSVTNWIGYPLGKIVSLGGSHVFSNSGHRHVRIRDNHGKEWHGYISEGMASNIRKCV